MPFMTWSDEYATGIDIVDRQHRGLMEMINAAAPLLLDCSPVQEAEREALFTGLVDYTGEHFRTEEALMREVGVDPRVYEHHRHTHARLVDDVLAWRARFSCRDPLAGQRLLGFLAGWLIFHVLGEDQTMARQIRAVRAGLGPADAYDQAEGARCVPTDAVLAGTVVALYSQLSGQIREIGLHNKHLEEQVRARTSDIAAMAEELRRARDAAEAASQAKSRFLAMVSHELRTPMNAIVGFADALRGSGLPARQEALVARVQTASRQLAELIDGLIEYSRDEAAAAKPFALRATLTEACQAPFAAARAKGLKVSLEIAPELPAWYLGDAGRIALVVRQLAANAAKFTSRGSVRVRAETLGPAPHGRLSVRLSVIDTGLGIPEDKQGGLFEAFHQLDDSATRHYGGVGLGLALTRQAARMMGAEIGLSSAPGRGSSFWLDLALAPVEPVQAGSPASRDEAADTAADASTVLAALARLLTEDDTRAGDLLATHEALLRRCLGARYDALAGQVAGFEFERALQTLRHQGGD
ncbi:bacteriohemerythrin [Parasulfuritortus cantonensis]|nr:bacteriohemerythrin [Parasulfuritortus cantonensis]